MLTRTKMRKTKTRKRKTGRTEGKEREKKKARNRKEDFKGLIEKGQRAYHAGRWAKWEDKWE